MKLESIACIEIQKKNVLKKTVQIMLNKKINKFGFLAPILNIDQI